MSTLDYRDNATYWRRYQPHLPAGLRLTEPPAEERWMWRGHDVHLDRFAVAGAGVSVVVLHGGGGYGRMLSPLGRIISEHGHEAVLPDLPGYGLTTSPHPESVRYEDWVACAVDLVARERSRGRRVVLMGLSMGGMLALHAAAAAPADAVEAVVATTLMDPRSRAVRRGAGRVPTPEFALRAAFADRWRLPMPLLAPVERMSSNPVVNRLCLRDPQGGGRRVPVGLLRSWMTYVPTIEPAAFDRCPVLLLHPLADRWTPVAWSRDVLDAIPAPTRFRGLASCEHWPMESPGIDVLRSELAGLLRAAADQNVPGFLGRGQVSAEG